MKGKRSKLLYVFFFSMFWAGGGTYYYSCSCDSGQKLVKRPVCIARETEARNFAKTQPLWNLEKTDPLEQLEVSHKLLKYYSFLPLGGDPTFLIILNCSIPFWLWNLQSSNGRINSILIHSTTQLEIQYVMQRPSTITFIVCWLVGVPLRSLLLKIYPSNLWSLCVFQGSVFEWL